MSEYLNFLRQRDSAPVKTILLVDDSPDVRQIVRTFLERDATFKVCGEAGGRLEGIKKAETTTTHLNFLFFLMSGNKGIEIANILKQTLPKKQKCNLLNYITEFCTNL